MQKGSIGLEGEQERVQSALTIYSSQFYNNYYLLEPELKNKQVGMQTHDVLDIYPNQNMYDLDLQYVECEFVAVKIRPEQVFFSKH